MQSGKWGGVFIILPDLLSHVFWVLLVFGWKESAESKLKSQAKAEEKQIHYNKM